MEVLRFFLTRWLVGAEQVLDCEAERVPDVPKIITEDIPSRHSCREPHMAEELAEVPTILYFLKQTVDTPVLRRGGVEGQQGFSPRTEFRPLCGSWSLWRSLRFSPRPGVFSAHW